jgi:hypothetical protein
MIWSYEQELPWRSHKASLTTGTPFMHFIGAPERQLVDLGIEPVWKALGHRLVLNKICLTQSKTKDDVNAFVLTISYPLVFVSFVYRKQPYSIIWFVFLLKCDRSNLLWIAGRVRKRGENLTSGSISARWLRYACFSKKETCFGWVLPASCFFATTWPYHGLVSQLPPRRTGKKKAPTEETNSWQWRGYAAQWNPKRAWFSDREHEPKKDNTRQNGLYVRMVSQQQLSLILLGRQEIKLYGKNRDKTRAKK